MANKAWVMWFFWRETNPSRPPKERNRLFRNRFFDLEARKRHGMQLFRHRLPEQRPWLAKDWGQERRFRSEFKENMGPQGSLNRKRRWISKFNTEKAVAIMRGNILHNKTLLSQERRNLLLQARQKWCPLVVAGIRADGDLEIHVFRHSGDEFVALDKAGSSAENNLREICVPESKQTQDRAKV
jgi:hypothetical protein